MGAVKKSKKKSTHNALGNKKVHKKARSKKKASKKKASKKKSPAKKTASTSARGKKVIGKKSGKLHKVPAVEPSHQFDLPDTRSDRKMTFAHKPNFDERDKKLSPQRKASGPDKKRRRPVIKAKGRGVSTEAPNVAPTKITLKKSK